MKSGGSIQLPSVRIVFGQGQDGRWAPLARTDSRTVSQQRRGLGQASGTWACALKHAHALRGAGDKRGRPPPKGIDTLIDRTLQSTTRKKGRALLSYEGHRQTHRRRYCAGVAWALLTLASTKASERSSAVSFSFRIASWYRADMSAGQGGASERATPRGTGGPRFHPASASSCAAHSLSHRIGSRNRQSSSRPRKPFQ